MITFTDEQYQYIMDRVTNGQQMLTWARVQEDKRTYLMTEAHKAFAELIDALKDGTIEAEV